MAYAKKKKRGESETVSDEELGTLITWVNEADDATSDSRDLAERCMDYRDGKQWTPTEVRKLNAQKQAATVMNRIKPKVDGLLGMEKTQRTTAKAFPRTPAHEGAADAATEAIRFVLQDNFYNEVRSNAFDDIIVPGTGGVCIKVEDDGNGGFKIVIKQVPWNRIIYDPHSYRKDFSDARYKGQVLWMDYDEAIDLYPDAKDVLESMQTGSSTYDDKPRWMDNTRRRVKIVEMYYYKGREMWYAIFTRGGWVKEPTISPFVNEEGETEDCYEYASPFIDRECNRYGAVAQYLDVQDEINKRRSKALHLMSVRQIAIQKGAVEDINKTRAELAKPDGVIELTQPLSESFEVMKTNDMAAAQFNLLTEAKSEIDAVGYNAAVAGKDQNAISGVALKQRQMSGQTELAPIFDCLKHLDHRVYRKVWNRIKQYWKAEKWVRVTDDEQNLKWVGLNTPITKGQQMLKQAQEQGTPPEQLAQLQQQIAADPMMQEVVSTENEVAELDVDIVIDDAPDAITTQIEDFQVLGEMVKSGFPIPPEAVILASPLSHKDRILKMMKEKPQLPPEVQEKMEEMGQQLQKLAQENQALKADQQVEMQKLQLEAQKSQQEMSLEVQKTQAELQLEREKSQQQLALEREKAAAQLQLEREKAAGQVALESEKANAQISLENKKIDAQADVQKRKAQADLKVKSIELGQDVEMPDPEEEARVEAERQQGDAQRMMELLTNTVGNPLQGILASLQTLIQLQQATLQAFERPRQIALSGVQRDAAGHIVAAQVSPTLN